MTDVLYRGSVKDLRQGAPGELIFDYTDAYSVFDWGRMPDLLPGKGQALATLAAHWFTELERPESWRDFSRSPVAQALRKSSRFGSAFMELGEKLQREGLRSHFLGTEGPADGNGPARKLRVRSVSVARPAQASVLGRALSDYAPTRATPAPRLVPLEVVFRFSCPEGSSLVDRVAKNPSYLAQIGFPGVKVAPGVTWDFPVLEVFTKLEYTDRLLPLGEALAISGLTGTQLEGILFNTAWVAAWLRHRCASQGIELADGKLEWAIGADGEPFLVDAIGPDELRLLKNGVQLSKEFLRAFYRETPWYARITEAKRAASRDGAADWKKSIEGPPPLPARHLALATELYLSLCNALTGRRWFESARALDTVALEVAGLGK
jgi:phosphoribosylaminoimidazole-succinocarboxamide synthase